MIRSMDKGYFQAKKFFDLSKFSFADVFDNADNVWEALPRLGEYIKEKNKGKKIVIGRGTVVEDGALIKGPAIIGRNCLIAHGAYIRKNVIVGDNVHIGHGVEIKNSIVLPDTAIAHLNYVGDSIIGSNVNISAGAIIANFRLDGKTIRLKFGDKTIDTGLVKFGAVIGDNSKIGVNAVLNPGTVLGKNCLVYPLTSVLGIHKDGEIIK